MIGAVAAPHAGRLQGAAGRVRHAVARVPAAAAVRALRDVPAAVADGALAAVFLAVMLVQLTRSASLPGHGCRWRPR